VIRTEPVDICLTARVVKCVALTLPMTSQEIRFGIEIAAASGGNLVLLRPPDRWSLGKRLLCYIKKV